MNDQPASPDRARAYIAAARVHLHEHHSGNRPANCPACHPELELELEPHQDELAL